MALDPVGKHCNRSFFFEEPKTDSGQTGSFMSQIFLEMREVFYSHSALSIYSIL